MFGKLTKLLLLPLLLLVLSGCIADKEEPEVSLGAGSALPAFRVTLLDGEVFDTSALADEGVSNLLILFFNTDCADCQRELPVMQTLYEEITADKALRLTTRFICIAREEGRAEVRAYWLAHHLTMPVSPQSDRSIYNLFANIGIPRLYLADPQTYTIKAVWPPDAISPEEVLSLLRTRPY